MKTNIIPLVITALAIGHVCAQGTRPTVDRKPPPALLMPALDTDKNGELSATEISNAPTALLTLDKDGDGILSKKEILPPPPKDKKARPPLPSPVLVKALDEDKDMALSGDEIEDAAIALGLLDKNRDGKIDKNELNPGKPRGASAT